MPVFSYRYVQLSMSASTLTMLRQAMDTLVSSTPKNNKPNKTSNYLKAAKKDGRDKRRDRRQEQHETRVGARYLYQCFRTLALALGRHYASSGDGAAKDEFVRVYVSNVLSMLAGNSAGEQQRTTTGTTTSTTTGTTIQ